MVTRAACKPTLHLGHFVSAIVVHYEMNIQVLWNGFVDSLQEAQKLLMPLAVVQRTNHFPSGYI